MLLPLPCPVRADSSVLSRCAGKAGGYIQQGDPAFVMIALVRPRTQIATGAQGYLAKVPWCSPMQQFVRRMNIEHNRKLLTGKLVAWDREAIGSLLAEEEAKELSPNAETAPAEPSDH